MKKWQINTILIILVVAIITIIPKIALTGNSIKNDLSSHTYAICDKNNYCEDYVVECENKIVKKLTPTGFSIQHGLDWKDDRPAKENLCE